METAVVQAPASSFYEWTFPGAPLRIHLYLDVVERLQREVTRTTTPGSGKEVGGILIGRATRSPAHVVEIRDFALVPCESRRDRGFVASPADYLRIQNAKADPGLQASGLAAVGFFRSHSRDVFGLDSSDLSLIGFCFNQPSDVILLIEPSSTGAGRAGFFFWDNGRIHSAFSFLEFPFDAQQLSLEAGSKAKADKEPSPKAVVELDALLEPRRARSALRPATLMWLTVGLLLIGALGVTGYLAGKGDYAPWRAKPAAESPAPDLALQIATQGSDWLVKWNRNFVLIPRATGGTLTILDGVAPVRTLPLDVNVLRTGSILYVPASDRVEFRLEVRTPDRAASESVIAIKASTSRTSVAPADPPVQPVTRAAQPALPRSSGIISETRPAPAPSKSPVEVSVAPPTPPPKPPSRVEMIEPPATTESSASLVPPAPVERITAEPPVAPTQKPDNPGPAPPGPAPPKIVPPATETVTQPAPAPAAVPVPSVSFVGPKVIRRTQPSLPLNIRSLIARETTVEVRVQISASGKVLRADPISQPGPLRPLLERAAAQAAALWTFEPALIEGKKVNSETVLAFRFSSAR